MATPRPAPRSLRQSLGSIVLGFELIVVFLGALVVFGLNAVPGVPSWWALIGGGVMVVAMAVTIGLLRYRWGVVIGWVLQLLVVASGFFVAALFIVGILFTALWAYCMITATRLEAQAPHPHPPTPTETENHS